MDAAWHLHAATGDEAPLVRTRTDDRIDQIWVSGRLVPALRGHELLDTPAGAGDHHGVLARIDPGRADPRPRARPLLASFL